MIAILTLYFALYNFSNTQLTVSRKPAVTGKDLWCYECTGDYVKKYDFNQSPCRNNVTYFNIRQCSTNDNYCKIEKHQLYNYIMYIDRGCVEKCGYGCRLNGYGIPLKRCKYCCQWSGCNFGSGSNKHTSCKLLYFKKNLRESNLTHSNNSNACKMVNCNKITHNTSSITFGLYNSKEILNVSVKQISVSKSLDDNSKPIPNGPLDPALGPTEYNVYCITCGYTIANCKGHFGHIELPVIMFNPYMFSFVNKLINLTCLCCAQLRMNPIIKVCIELRLKALSNGNVGLSHKLNNYCNHLLQTINDFEAMEDNRLEVEMTQDMNEIPKKDLKSGTVIEIIDKLKKFYKDYTCELENDTTTNRGLEFHRQEILTKFLSGGYSTASVCTYCFIKHRNIKSEYHSKLYLSRGYALKEVETFIKSRNEINETGLYNITWEEILNQYSIKSGDFIKDLKSHHRYITASECKTHLTNVLQMEKNLLFQVFGVLELGHTLDVDNMDRFFFKTIFVTPNTFRPLNIANSVKVPCSKTIVYQKIIEQCHEIDNLKIDLEKIKQNGIDIKIKIETETTPEPDLEETDQTKVYLVLEKSIGKLQAYLNCLFDSELGKNLKMKQLKGLKQLIERKEGLFRQNIMGKRVDFAARSVISPDPLILTREVGIPTSFALVLTFPEVVNNFNAKRLAQCVKNGPLIFPGARFLEYNSGKKIYIHPKNEEMRLKFSNLLLDHVEKKDDVDYIKIVHRHMIDGDLVLLNRQPSLHRPSMQAHIVKILPGEKTMRLHYSACKAYNADFDGDEMNAHFPQTEQGRVELINLALTDKQYLTPKNGAPLAGLIQDHIVAGTLFSIRGKFFDRVLYHKFVYVALADFIGKEKIKLINPSIIKPKELWSGKDIISTIVLALSPKKYKHCPFNFKSRSKVTSLILNEKTCEKTNLMSECNIVFRNGRFLVGILDKASYGATAYGLVHAMFELYGSTVAANFLSALSKLFTSFIQLNGFTFGIEDILLTRHAEKARRKIIKNIPSRGQSVLEKYVKSFDCKNLTDSSVLERYISEANFDSSFEKLKKLDYNYKIETDSIQNDICRIVMPAGLLKKFPKNNLQLMVNSGAKGSIVNCQQISCTLGQIDLEGQRPKKMLSGRNLPSFEANDCNPEIGGFVAARFLTGISPQNYYYHCMAGREGLIDTACKTSRSGYLQRCLIKHLETLYIAYDRTVRDCDGSIIQFKYGEDGLHVEKSSYLNSTKLEFILENLEILNINNYDGSSGPLQNFIKCDQSKRLWRNLNKKKKEKKLNGHGNVTTGFDLFCSDYENQLNPSLSVKDRSVLLRNMWNKKLKNDFSEFTNKYQDFVLPDPPSSVLNIDKSIGAVSEKIHAFISMCCNNEDLLNVKKRKMIKKMLYAKCYNSQVEPGDCVGILAAQSIGEPSTQMTLNTFHFAGKGEMNVTLGIPRMTEILMTASEVIKTPYMEAIILHGKKRLRKAEKLTKKLNQIYFHQVVDKADISEKLKFTRFKPPSRNFKVKLFLCDSQYYQFDTFLSKKLVLKYIESKFINILITQVKRKLVEISKQSLISSKAYKPKDSSAVTENALETENPSVQNEDSESDKSSQCSISDQELSDYSDNVNDADDVSDDNIIEKSKSEHYKAVQEDVILDSNFKLLQEPLYDENDNDDNLKYEKRVQFVIQQDKIIQSYDYDAKDFNWCEFNLEFPLSPHKIDFKVLLQKIINTTKINSIPGITKCILNKNPKTTPKIQMDSEITACLHRLNIEGVNFKEMYKYSDIIDLNYIYSNDIHAISKAYGIEAAYAVTIQEINNVFGAYGIEVDRRHLSLVVDYMTYDGYVKPFSRNGIQTISSPIQKMSFEMSLSFLRSAILSGSYILKIQVNKCKNRLKELINLIHQIQEPTMQVERYSNETKDKMEKITLAQSKFDSSQKENKKKYDKVQEKAKHTLKKVQVYYNKSKRLVKKISDLKNKTDKLRLSLGTRWNKIKNVDKEFIKNEHASKTLNSLIEKLKKRSIDLFYGIKAKTYFLRNCIN
ncbi:DNA-directed RNA polymerase I largest subunit [Intoshia linei]|uniref:DNA-directed RNA polymerase subunit n=1 Tax=Intoshia linei TaxID=1819745 RepID=A0A177B6C2_9BILA|nr:DNA-directed RNA polymerase I largest subunit [Intoshia linei]